MTDVRHDENRDSISDSESRLMEALLVRTCAPNAREDHARVARLIASISKETGGLDPLPSRQANRASNWELRRSRILKRAGWWMLPAVSATLLLGLLAYLPEGNAGNQALAALEESLRADAATVGRHYVVTMRPKTESGQSLTERQSDLFVNGEDFAIHVQRGQGDQGIWIGSYRGEQWLVPRAGPVMVGREPYLKQRLLQHAVAETPFLSISSVLERTKRHYNLKFEKAVDLVTPQGIQRYSLVTGGRKKKVSTFIPHTVKVWAEQETGFVKKIELVWEPDDQAAWISATAEWVDSPELSEDFFQHQAHHDSKRRVMDQESD